MDTDAVTTHAAEAVETPEQLQADIVKMRLMKSVALRRLVTNASLLAGGLAVTGFTYLQAVLSPTGGSYLLMWGALMFGTVYTLRSVRWYRRVSTVLARMENRAWSAGVIDPTAAA